LRRCNDKKRSHSDTGISVNIVLVSSEAVPFAKTGGLADVATGLVRALGRAGHSATLILPYHRQFISEALAGEATDVTVTVQLGERIVTAEVRRGKIPGSDCDVLLIDHPGYFDRPGIYVQDGGDYADNGERFIFFSRAAMEAIRAFDLKPDVIHANDWQTGIVPALLTNVYREQPVFEKTVSVFTIHNMAFQGCFPAESMWITGLPATLFNHEQLEFFEQLNLLKAGIVFADKVTTVSPTYATEITTSEYGYGLEGVLAERGEDLAGVLNGVDGGDWNPVTDPHLTQQYDVDCFARGKRVNRRALLKEFGLDPEFIGMVCGMVSRMTDQKGFDLILGDTDRLMATGSTFIFLGNGDMWAEPGIQELAAKYPDRVGVRIGYNEGLSHQIEAGIDMFLMPSRFEPCGLNQMYSLLYGSPPLVHNVGGLADSVIDTTPESLSNGTANGFVFDEYNVDSFIRTFRRAESAFQDTPVWEQIISHGMSQDLSWNASAERYLELYRSAR